MKARAWVARQMSIAPAPVRNAGFSLAFARHLSAPGRCLLAQASPAQTIRAYRPRDASVTIFLRHHTGDVGTFDEIYIREIYRPPAEVRRALGSVSAPLVVGDLGANIGLFAAYVLDQFEVERIVAFEPDPVNSVLLERVALANRGRAGWRLELAAASNRAGEVPFLGGRYATSRVGGAGETDVRVPAVDVFPALAGVDLLKIDIEGSEWPILGDPRMAALSARAVVLEYHPDGCPGGQAQSLATSLLTGAGYRVLEPQPGGPPGHGMLWAVRG